MTAYDVNPYKGSESGTGWNWANQASRFNKVKLVTRKNNRFEIERYITTENIDVKNIEFHYFDLPYYLRFWKKGARGSSFYFRLWRLFLPIFIIKNKISFDIAHSLNFHSDAYPTFLWLFNKPLVWGPICHNEKIPNGYLPIGKDYFVDRSKWMIKKLIWEIDILLFLSIRQSDIIIASNTSVLKRLKIKNKDKVVTMSYLGSERIKKIPSKNKSKFQIIAVGRFISIKSFNLALDAFHSFYKSKNSIEQKNISLLFVGVGPELKKIKKQSKELGLDGVVKFLGWVNKHEINQYYEDSSVFLMPSHEGGGMVVIEALSHSLPVVCFENYGPGEIVDDKCSIKIKYTNYDQSINDFSNGLNKIYSDEELSDKMSINALKLFNKKYLWEYKGDALKKIYEKIK